MADGAPGLISAIEEIWPRADRQHRAVHRLRNLIAKLPKSEHDRIRFNYWSALTDATSVKDGKLRLEQVNFSTAPFWPAGPGAKLYSFMLFPELARENSATENFETLIDLLAHGRIDPQIDLESSWRTPGPPLEALVARRVNGKAVLHID